MKVYLKYTFDERTSSRERIHKNQLIPKNGGRMIPAWIVGWIISSVMELIWLVWRFRFECILIGTDLLLKNFRKTDSINNVFVYERGRKEEDRSRERGRRKLIKIRKICGKKKWRRTRGRWRKEKEEKRGRTERNSIKTRVSSRRRVRVVLLINSIVDETNDGRRRKKEERERKGKKKEDYLQLWWKGSVSWMKTTFHPQYSSSRCCCKGKNRI